MYTKAELFTMAADPEISRVLFLNNVTMTVPDDASDCVDLDAEKKRLSNIWVWRTCPCGSWSHAPECRRQLLQNRRASR